MRTLTTTGDEKTIVTSSQMKDVERQKRRLLFWLGVLLCVVMAFVLNRSAPVRFQSDLFARWYAARMLVEEGRDLYDARNGEEVVAYKQLQTSPLEAGFYYPAHLLVFLAPLSRVPFEIAHLIWTSAILLFSFSGLWIVMQILDMPSTANQLAVYTLMALLFIPTLQNAIWSQFDSIAVISLALVYMCLVKEKYFLAGVLASGLTFKPQVALLAMGFILLWSVLSRRRWRLPIGFGASMLALWGLAEWMQPGWVGDFGGALQEYQRLPYEVVSVLDGVWNPGQVVAIVLLCAAAAVFVLSGKTQANEPVFAANLALSQGLGWLVVPVIGMLHLVVMPVALVMLLYAIRETLPGMFRATAMAFIVIYFSGYAGFIYGLARPESYGLHIQYAEMAYKAVAPALIGGISFYLVLRSLRSRWQDA